MVQREGSAWALTGKPWTFDAERWQALAQVREREAGLMRAFAAGEGCLMRFLQEALDDPDPGDCGRCSVCTGTLPGPGARPGADARRGGARASRAARTWSSSRASCGRAAVRPGRKGKIVGCSEGRALAFADDPGWADALLPLFAAPDGPAPQPVLDGVVGVLGRWRRSWGARPVAVVPMPSAQHPQLVALGGGARGGGRPAAAGRRAAPGRPACPTPTWLRAPRWRRWSRRWSLRPEVDVPAGPLLLVDARYRSGWSMTVAAALLREAGADRGAAAGAASAALMQCSKRGVAGGAGAVLVEPPC